ncbi:hypothetical protein F2P81_011033 [Scophthalmus maximus]|uniref:Uncharacterized protein n=1 Tax=Scophthalmus maximus TaxID=52904 RepID=A0A6A4SXG2_SCOMX|nr:hypothetical protein F2P81_011033 [Scophthalmus maximus]
MKQMWKKIEMSECRNTHRASDPAPLLSSDYDVIKKTSTSTDARPVLNDSWKSCSVLTCCNPTVYESVTGEREDDRGSCGQSGRLFRAGVTHTRARHNKSIVKSTHKYDVISTVTEK